MCVCVCVCVRVGVARVCVARVCVARVFTHCLCHTAGNEDHAQFWDLSRGGEQGGRVQAGQRGQ